MSGIRILRTSWIGKWYSTWVSLGGIPPKFGDNFCHFVRVLLIYGPLRYFFCRKLVGMPCFAWAVMGCIMGMAIWVHGAITIFITVAAGTVILCLIGISVIYAYEGAETFFNNNIREPIRQWRETPTRFCPRILFIDKQMRGDTE